MSDNETRPVAWMTHHDEPMLFPTREEALTHCDDNEEPIALYTAQALAARDAEIERLRRDNMHGQMDYLALSDRCDQFQQRAEQAEARAVAKERDAQRYRWLRDCDLEGDEAVHIADGRELKTGADLDAAIDEAMARAARAGGGDG
jgi:hypothetical protein